MKITFPHMGNIYLAAKALFDGLGVEYIIPPQNSKKALEIGSLYSPEEICLPFKIMIGNYIQAIEKGADTIILPGSCGPCRFGEYCEMQIMLLKRLGYNLDFIVIDAPTDIGIRELYRRLNKISSKSNKSINTKMKSIFDAIKVMNLIDEIEASVHNFAGHEKISGECKSILNNCKKDALNCNSPKEMIDLLMNYKEKTNHISLNINRNPLKIAIIGEIYTVIEPFANLYIEDKLMDFGVSTKRMLTPSWWVKNTALLPTKLNSLNIKKSSKKYLSLNIGGHARECIGEAVLVESDDFDGAIQIFPMGCMPEIVSKSILPKISKDKDFPIMSLVVDEMTGDAGYVTRIEAFIDLLERRRNNVLFRS
ncbi:putative nucleotide-binding protein (sugar kinase/HSP70/actin superfamily) [Sedimentibacter acidaminivorans]|uniref:Nucleotide-binding protein (Sugar kinase/HSP70/actin superfamily) n=1 Tax=Sedimentibacter acidaminivorans TaxID=913099 RepID=A0ABS4GCC2_9FIRM|nr:acyl-CoA dehydratase activase-related protein [Sedimentibacter acidaminivorans]MBP1925343.1 putative nucleotide-binding protein (sugar kinase/HSP70/actin superfamily) [Sedimentibacter acidaminivorans]